MNKIKETEGQLKALANRRRLAILCFLHRKGAASVGAVAEEISLSFKSTSAHLLILSKADLVEREQVSTTMRYSLPKPLPPLLRAVLSIL